jgi:uncharacterized protein YdhG (YjbR/CyaY superfamily)
MPAATTDEYLAQLPTVQRAALSQLRELIRAEAPDAVETISYGLPAFKLDGRFFVGFGAAKRHCSFYAGAAPVRAHADELAGYRVLKGTVNFQPDQPLPAELVRKLVQVRLAEFRSR